MKIEKVEQITLTRYELDKIYEVMELLDKIWENSNNENNIKIASEAVETLQDFVESIDFKIED